MQIKYHISPSNITEDFQVKVWEAESDTPGAEVYTEDLLEDAGGGHPTPTTVIINGMDNVVHIVRLIGKTSGNIFHYWSTEPLATGTATVFAPIRFKIGDGGTYTPAALDDTFTHPDLLGLLEDDFEVFRNNVGWLFPEIHYTIEASGFKLVNPDKFNDTEEFIVQRHPIMPAVPVHDSVVGKLFGGFLDVAADTVFDATHLRKLIRFDGTCKFSFNVNPPRGYLFAFQHYGGVTGTGTIEFNNATLLWSGVPKNTFAIEAGTEAAFTFDGTNWNVVYVKTKPQAASITSTGTVFVGDIVPVPGSKDMNFTVTHNLNIVGDYKVFYSLVLHSGDPFISNDVTSLVYDKTANSFKISFREYEAVTQSLKIDWMILK